MEFFKKQRAKKDIELIVEERLYEHVAKEIAAGETEEGKAKMKQFGSVNIPQKAFVSVLRSDKD